ncbi:hypothetical protein [Enterobacter phage SDFMU_EhYP]|uniref:Uncharacterized protein n=1 Tax=Enterobacter phage SDFMU_EhYP TaxID=3076128 RepID=A0AA96KRF3_9CAUD|nr:hypothetical protein [Enterobacter phage SDFMU_EhYP]
MLVTTLIVLYVVIGVVVTVLCMKLDSECCRYPGSRQVDEVEMLVYTMLWPVILLIEGVIAFFTGVAKLFKL